MLNFHSLKSALPRFIASAGRQFCRPSATSTRVVLGVCALCSPLVSHFAQAQSFVASTSKVVTYEDGAGVTRVVTTGDTSKGFYNGVDFASWLWQGSGSVSPNPLTLGDFYSGTGQASPDGGFFQQGVNYVTTNNYTSAHGLGEARGMVTGSAKQTINWFWDVDDETQHPAPSVEPQYGFPAILHTSTNTASGGWAHAGMIYGAYVGTTAVGEFKAFSGNTYYDAPDANDSVVYIGERVANHFTTEQSLSGGAHFVAGALNASDSARSEVSANARFDIYLLNPVFSTPTVTPTPTP